jgi:hypothetical protein
MFIDPKPSPMPKVGGKVAVPKELTDEGLNRHYLFLTLLTFVLFFVQQTPVKERILKENHRFFLSLLLCFLSCRSKKGRVTEVCAYGALDSNRLILTVPPARLKLSTAEGR